MGAVVLSTMSSGVLQAAAARLWVLPPQHVPDAEFRRTVIALLTRSLQFMPQAHHSDSGQCQPMHEAYLCAHAHQFQGEILLETCRLAGSEKPQQRQQRVAWHIERARLALHSTETTSAAACCLLVHLHILQAKLLGQGGAGTRRQTEQTLDELVTGCRTIASVQCSGDESAPVQFAYDQSCKMLLHQLQVVLRILCTREVQKHEKLLDAHSHTRFKELYRATLQIKYTELASVPEQYDASRSNEL